MSKSWVQNGENLKFKGKNGEKALKNAKYAQIIHKKLNLINNRKKMSRQAVTDNIYGLDKIINLRGLGGYSPNILLVILYLLTYSFKNLLYMFECMIFFFIFSEPMDSSTAPAVRKGTWGTIGSISPIKPSNIKNTPKIINNNLLMFFPPWFLL